HQAERADSPVSANPSEPSELLASAQLAEQANWLSSLSLLIDICVAGTGGPRPVAVLRKEIEDLDKEIAQLLQQQYPRRWYCTRPSRASTGGKAEPSTRT
ncbi:hypothetical protein Alg130_11655, partial [Pyrenophora tritici-repentis]